MSPLSMFLIMFAIFLVYLEKYHGIKQEYLEFDLVQI
jgi:hypothetical protein